MFVSCFGPKHHPFNNILADMALEPEAIQVNLNGQRWVDEAVHLHGMTPYISRAAQGDLLGHRQPGQLGEPSPDSFLNNPAMAKRRWQFETWEADLEEESKLDTPAKKADTLEELAALCGMPAEALTETVTPVQRVLRQGRGRGLRQGRRAPGAHLRPRPLLRHLRPALLRGALWAA